MQLPISGVDGQTSEIIMNVRRSTAIAATLALAALGCIGLSSTAAEAGPIVPQGHYCLWYAEGGTDCSFTSYQQCEETASGLAAECYGKAAREESGGLPAFGWSPRRHGRD